MKRIKIGLFPYTRSLQSPADRRRLVSWAKKKGHQLLLYETKGVDLIFLSEGCDFLRYSRVSTAPKVFDLIDGYLGLQGDYSDMARGVAKSILRKHQTYPRAYSSIVQETCRNVDLVVCSSPEQRVTVLPFNRNVEVILDNHSEIPDMPFKLIDNNRGSVALWEGTPHTLQGLENLVVECDSLPNHINIVTDLTYFKYMNRYLRFDTASRLRRTFGSQQFNLTSWSVPNLVSARELSNFSLIPVDENDSIQALKPENRLLIMFKLGIPTLTSNISSYARIERLLNSKFTCNSWEDWETKICDLIRNPEIGEHQINLGKRYLAQFHNEDLLFDAWDRAIQGVL